MLAVWKSFSMIIAHHAGMTITQKTTRYGKLLKGKFIMWQVDLPIGTYGWTIRDWDGTKLAEFESIEGAPQ